MSWQPASDVDRLRLDLEMAELEAGGHAYALTAAAGDPQARRRDRLPHEAHVDFDAIEADLDAARDRVAGVALRLRPAVLERLLMHVDAAATSPLATIAGLQLPGSPTIGGVAELVAAAASTITVVLHDVAAAAAARVHAELLASGMPVAKIRPRPRYAHLAAADPVSTPSVAVSAGTAEALSAQALRVAATPVSQLLDAASTSAAGSDGPTARPEAVARALADVAAGLSDRGVVDVAGQAVNRAAGLGRADGIDALEEDVTVGAGDGGGVGGGGQVLIYASELIDRNTCYPCALIDGQEYLTEAAAADDYPFGQYAACLGGGRCRGMLVYVWSPEAPPTIGLPR